MAAAAPMEAQTSKPPSDPSSATYPRLAEPPAVSCVCLHIPDGLDARDSEVLAAHGDSVLIEVSIEEKHGYMTDHFVYNAGDAAADPPRLPSLSLLPPFHLAYHGTGLVRHGEDELVVAQLLTVSAARPEPATLELMRVADLSLFRAGEWSVRRLQIRFRDASKVRELPSFWNAVVAVGDRLLCWVDQRLLGVMLCDEFEETPRLQYLLLPRENICGQPSNRNVCATAGGDGDTLKFVNIFPHCCCGGDGASGCKRSRHAYTIHTWTMRIGNDNDDIGWVKDGMVDAIKLWGLDSYKGLRWFPLDHPVVSMDDPDLICFWLHEPPVDGYWNYRDRIFVTAAHNVACHHPLLGMKWPPMLAEAIGQVFLSQTVSKALLCL
ncbi:unnamed protein product [Miscanthus lutarioriparius]|uniref:DUF1618 domain-containing protein n=1 Tax=Miscanthus lutarioriparius TaxID=422564 RepID=A0A811Q6A1_9POAL|nr:unnamed protein product [Miscanthus lutarioriparius]